MQDVFIIKLQDELQEIDRKKQQLEGREQMVLEALDWYRNLKRQGLLKEE